MELLMWCYLWPYKVEMVVQSLGVDGSQILIVKNQTVYNSVYEMPWFTSSFIFSILYTLKELEAINYKKEVEYKPPQMQWERFLIPVIKNTISGK